MRDELLGDDDDSDDEEVVVTIGQIKQNVPFSAAVNLYLF